MSPVYGTWPAVVVSYDGPARMCRVSVPGVTDGSNVLPLAEIKYPVGDRPTAPNSKDHTEIRILIGDKVYVEFLCGDPRFPLITGHRLEREGNPTDWRRWHHENIETTADSTHIVNATDLIFRVSNKVTWEVGGDVVATIGGSQTTDVTGAMKSTANTSQHTSATHLLMANTTIAGAVSTIAGLTGSVGVTMRGPFRIEGSTYEVINMTVTFTGCTITSNGKKIDHTHAHNEKNNPGGPTDPPNA